MLDREEYIEQAHFFRAYRERLDQNMSSQEILDSINEEILSTTNLPVAIEFLAGEIKLHGRISNGMAHIKHYFTPFQTFVMSKSEEDKARFDQRAALGLLQKEAEYRADNPTAVGLFFFQFECVARNSLGYDAGMTAISEDWMYDDAWKDWILKIRRLLGTVDFADLIYFRSQHAVEEKRRSTGNADYQAENPVLFGLREGRIAKANRGRDPLFMFAALQRQLEYPTVPRPKPKADAATIHPILEERFQRIEQTLKVIQMELKAGIDLSEFFVKPENFDQTDQDANETS